MNTGNNPSGHHAARGSAEGLTVSELIAGLRAGAEGSYPAEAATELLVRHGAWLARPWFVQECVYALDDRADVLAVDWRAVQTHVGAAQGSPAERAIALVAAQLGGYPDPADEAIDLQGMPPLAWLLVNLERRDVDLVLAAVSHAAGTQDHVDHVMEPGESGEWRVTSTSPRLRPGPLHPWPEFPPHRARISRVHDER
ncbi:hypothetical protein [Cellulomonas denverensis]|uniref:hypothetical protein n=1 Tax=Cellulomonas denverensis TaxID=264297 RepID=UPI0035E66D2E